MTDVPVTPQDHMDRAPDAMVTFNAEGVVSWTNAAAAELFRYSPAAFVGLPVSALIPERLRSVHDAHHERYKEKPAPSLMDDRSRDLVALRSDGSEFLAEISLGPVGVGGDLSVLTVIRDITPRREAAIENETIRLALDSVAEAVFMFDVDTLGLRYANGAARKQIGLGPEDLLGEASFPDISHPTRDATVQEMIEPLLAGDRLLVTYDAVHSGSGQKEFDVEVLVQRAGTLAFGHESFIALARDTTARKRHEMELAQEAHQRHQRETQLGLAQERERIARRLQDSVIQRLFAVGIRLQAADGQQERLAAAADAAVTEIDRCITEVRDTIFTLEER